MLVVPPDDPAIAPERPVVFLAGPIQGAERWQDTAAALFRDRVPSLVVASPRRGAFDVGDLPLFEEQVDWETRWLRRAGRTGVVLFWLARQSVEVPGRSYGQTTRFELGEWIARAVFDADVRLAVGIEEGFTSADYIRRRLAQDLPRTPVVDSLPAVVDAAATLVGERAAR